MSKYKFSNAAKEDLIRIHHFGVETFGMDQADKYFNTFFDYFEIIAQQPFAFTRFKQPSLENRHQ